MSLRKQAAPACAGALHPPRDAEDPERLGAVPERLRRAARPRRLDVTRARCRRRTSAVAKPGGHDEDRLDRRVGGVARNGRRTRGHGPAGRRARRCFRGARTITVTGSGTARGVPDTGRLLVRRRDRRRDGTGRLGGERRGTCADVIAALVAAGVASVPTCRRRMSPSTRGATTRGRSDGSRRAARCSATVRDIARAGKACRCRRRGGANQVSGPQLRALRPLRALPAGAARRVRRRQGEGAVARRGGRRRARPGAADRRGGSAAEPVYPMAMRAEAATPVEPGTPGGAGHGHGDVRAR